MVRLVTIRSVDFGGALRDKPGAVVVTGEYAEHDPTNQDE